MNEITPTPKVQTIENATLDDVRPGDHLDWEWTRVRNGVTITSQRVGIAYHRDSDGDWWAVEGGWLTQGEGKDITLTIRRPIQDLPTKPGTVIVRADGHKYIEATGSVSGATWRTKEAVLGADGRWYGVWRGPRGAACSVASDQIDLDTWKVDSV